MIEVEGVRKSFGSTVALAGVDLQVAEGTVLGLLGPNGAGKTTLVRVLATLLKPDAGRAVVAGHDVVDAAQAVRSVIGLGGQFAAVDEHQTGRENLEMVGRLYGLGRAEARRAALETLERLSLTDAANRLVKTYSGGMRRRLDLGASLVGRPRVLILDEPTTGLDPRTRIELWDFIRVLVREGTTLLLTTQYLEEADELADHIVVIDHGSVIAQGSATQLKQRLGGDLLDITTRCVEDLGAVAELLVSLGAERPQIDERDRHVRVAVGDMKSVDLLLAAARRVDEAGIALDDIGIRRPSLDDVFLALTGHGADAPAERGAA